MLTDQNIKDIKKLIGCKKDIFLSSVNIVEGSTVTGCYKFAVDSDGDTFWNNGGVWTATTSSGGGGGGIQSIVAGDNITVDNTDPDNPIVNSTGGADTNLATTDLVQTSSPRTYDGGTGNLAFSNMNDFTINTPAYEDGIFGVNDDGTAYIGDRQGDNNQVYVEADDPNQRINLNAPDVRLNGNSLNQLGGLVTIQGIVTLAAITPLWDYSLGSVATLTMAGNSVLTITNLSAPCFGTLKVTTLGGATLTLPAGSLVVNNGAGIILLTAGSGNIDILSFFYDGTNLFWNSLTDFT